MGSCKSGKAGKYQREFSPPPTRGAFASLWKTRLYSAVGKFTQMVCPWKNPEGDEGSMHSRLPIFGDPVRCETSFVKARDRSYLEEGGIRDDLRKDSVHHGLPLQSN